MRRLWNLGAAALAVVVLLAVTGGGMRNVRAATLACTSLAPVLQDTTVNQGLNSYPSLVRGKETLVRFYFSLPACAVAGNAIQINSAQLTVRNGATATSPLLTAAGGIAALAPIGTSPAPLITSTAKQWTSTGDPQWVVPGSVLAPGGTTASFTARFDVTVAYQSKTCETCALSAQTTSTFPASTAVTKVVAAKTNALRLLVVPLGIAPQAPSAAPTIVSSSGTGGPYTYRVSSTSVVGDSPLTPASASASGPASITWPAVAHVSGYKVYRNDQLLASLASSSTSYTDNGTVTPPISQTTSAAQQSLQSALSTVERLLPIEDAGARLGDLGGVTSPAALRYTVNTGFVDISGLSGYDAVSGNFCGSAASFSSIDTSLMSILNAYNASNSANPADRVVGVVDGAVATAAAPGNACLDGGSSPNAADLWFRLAPDAGGVRSKSGAIAAQELEHSWGIQPRSRSNGAYHSINSGAHATAGDPGKTFNVLERSYVTSHVTPGFLDRTALIPSTTTGVNDSVAFLENADWNDTFCRLGGPVPTLAGSACAAATRATTGTATNLPASAPGPAMAVTALTNGSPSAGTIRQSFVDNLLVTLTAPDLTSPYHLVERNAANGILLDFQAPAAPIGGHNDHEFFVDPEAPVLVAGTITRPVGTTKLELWKGAPGAAGSVLIDSVGNDGSPPTVTNPSAVPANENALQITPGGSRVAGGIRLGTAPIPPKPDIVYLADTTSSMGTALDTVRSQIPAIADTVRSSQPGAQFGAAHYKDLACDGDVGYVLDHSVTDTVADVSSAIAANPDNLNAGWTASGGCDTAEDQLNALYQIATNPTAVGWREGSTRIVAWFGDATGHNPSGDHSLDEVKAALVSANIRVVAVNVGSGGLDADGQATAIAAATGGSVASSSSSSDVAAALVAGLQNLPVTVAVTANCDTAGFSLSVTPPSQTVTSGSIAGFSFTMNVGESVNPRTYTVICHLASTFDGVPGAPIEDASFTVDVSGLSGPHTLITFTAADNSTGPLHGNVLIKCNGLYHVLKSNIVSDATGHFAFDTTRGCPGGQFYVDATDGWFLTAPALAAPVTLANEVTPPNVSIASPTATSSILQFGNIALSGSGKSRSGAALSGGQLVWKLDGTQVGTGNTLDLRPPATAAGWGAGTTPHTLVLTGTDAGGLIGTVSMTLNTLGDADNDGISTAQEAIVNACGSLPNPDNNPYNATADNDGDGIPNGDDAAPCTPATDFEAQSLMLPFRLDLSSTEASLALSGFYLQYKNLGEITRPNVRIAKIGGFDVSGPQFVAKLWLPLNHLAGAVFDRQAVIAFIRSNHPEFVNRHVEITVVGTSTTGGWTFRAAAPVYVFKS
jgi:hypothetical protein